MAELLYSIAGLHAQAEKLLPRREKTIYIENILVYIDIALANKPREECTLPLRLH